jgi:hypothetical protein
MEQLATPELKKPMDRTLMGNDEAALRNLVGMLNDPGITGAVVPPEEKAAMKQRAPVPAAPPPLSAPVTAGLKAQHAPPLDNNPAIATPPPPFTATQTSPTVAAPSHSPAQKIFFTGHPGVGCRTLAARIQARVFNFDDPIYSMAAASFGLVGDSALLLPFVAEVRAWGEGTVSKLFPLTAARALFCDRMHASGAEGDALFGSSVAAFGAAGFWEECLLARMARYFQAVPTGRAVVINVTTPNQFMALQKQGYRHYHVSCHAATRDRKSVV